MKFKISIDDGIALLEIDDRVYQLEHIRYMLDRYTNHSRKAHAICEKYNLGLIGDSTIEVCLRELERRLESDRQKMDETLK